MEFMMQPIMISVVLEEVNKSDLQMDPLHYPVAGPLPEIPLPPMKAVSSNGQICGADGAAESPMEDSHAESIEQVDPKKPGWACGLPVFEGVRLNPLDLQPQVKAFALVRPKHVAVRKELEASDDMRHASGIQNIDRENEHSGSRMD